MRKKHTSREYESELKDLKSQLATMAYDVKAMIHDSMNALQKKDIKLAEEVIERDFYINQIELEIDEFCLIILARRQPLAKDLRFITIALKMVTDLERMGDMTVSIARRVIKLQKMPPVKIPDKILLMAKSVQEMLQLAIESLLESDATKADQVLEQDDSVDELYHQNFRDLIKLMAQNENLIEPLVHLQSIAKWLERLGDHCTNLAEFVVFKVSGENVRHVSRAK